MAKHTFVRIAFFLIVILAGAPAINAASAYTDLANEYEFAIVMNPAAQLPPAIFGNIVVWEDQRSALGIYGKNTLTGEELIISTGPWLQTEPAIYENIVVWTDQRLGSSHIYRKNLSTGEISPVCTAVPYQQSPAIYGDYVVWQDGRGGIYGKRLSTGEEFLVSNTAATNPPAIYGNIVLYRKGYPTYGLYGKNIQTGEDFPICTNPNSAPRRFKIWGNIVVWVDGRNTPNPENIYGADISDIHNPREFPVCVGNWGKTGPAIYNNIVIWSDSRNGASDIYGADINDIQNPKEFPLCTASGSQGNAAIHRDTCVWMDKRDGWENPDIYANKVLPAIVVEEKRFSFDPVGATASDPINTLTGNFYHNEIDLTIPGSGMNFEFSRAYNASDSYSGPLGPGWTHNYNVFLVQDPCDTMHRVKWGDGQGHYYLPDVNIPNSYHPATSALYDKLKKNPDNSWVVTRKDQTRYNFNTSGKLVSVVDKNGSNTFLLYDGNGRLSQITDTANRIIAIAYNGSGLVQSITDPNSRQILYGYTGGKLTSVTDPNGNAESYGYDPGNGKLKTITDRKGIVTLTNVFDSFGRVIQQINSRGKISSFAYNTPSQNKTTITDPLGRQTIHTYDEYLRMVSITDPCGNLDSYTYDNKGNRTSITDKKGNLRRFIYDDRGNVLTTISPPADPNADPNNPNFAMVSVVTYDANNNPLTKIDANGTDLKRKWTYQYDPNGNLIRTVDPNDKQSSRSYTIRGLLVSETDENEHITRYTYDPNGNLTDVNDPCGNIAHYTYDSIGRMLTKRDARDHTTIYTYDKNNNLLAETDPCGNSITYTYDKNNNKTSTTDKRDNTWRIEYNNNNIVFREADPCGFETLYEYDDVDNRISVTDKRGKKTRYTYDALNQVTDINDPLGHHMSYAYDAKGNKISQTNALGKTWTYKYDALDRLIEEKDPLENVTSYEYDLLDRKIAFIDAKGNRTQYGYDTLDRLINVTDALGNITQYEYDPAGNLITIIDANEKISVREYDALNRLITEIDPLGNITEYQYDEVGNQTAKIDAMSRTTNYKYDQLNRLIEVDYPDGNTVTYRYDENGNRISMIDWNGFSVFEYDKLNRMTANTDAFGKIVQYRYDEKGNRKVIVYPDGNSVTYNYDDADRLQTIMDWNSRTTTYSYDAANNLKSVLLPNLAQQLYNYDNASRLILVQNKDKDGNSVGSFQYTLDAIGNRIEIQESNTLSPVINFSNTPYTYDDADRLETAGVCTYAFNDNGDQTSRNCSGSTSNYTYDPKDLLINVTRPGLNLQHTYDGSGNRIARKQGILRKRYVLDLGSSMSQVLCETNSVGTISAYYIYGVGLLAKITPDGTQRYYHYDGLGSTAALTNQSGLLTDRYTYSPFGEILNTQGSTNNPFKFVGRFGVITEPDGTLFMRARFYEPTTGRFLSKDPIEGIQTNPQTLHSYIYAVNRPTFSSDPSGKIAPAAAILITGGIGAIIGGGSYAIGDYWLGGQEWNWSVFSGRTVGGAAAGAAAPIAAAAGLSTAAVGGVAILSGGIGYLADQASQQVAQAGGFGRAEEFSFSDLAINTIMGAVAEKVFPSYRGRWPSTIESIITGKHMQTATLNGITEEVGTRIGEQLGVQGASIARNLLTLTIPSMTNVNYNFTNNQSICYSSGNSSQVRPSVNVPVIVSTNPQTYSQTYTSTTRKYK